jgi:hypothetical protein
MTHRDTWTVWYWSELPPQKVQQGQGFQCHPVPISAESSPDPNRKPVDRTKTSKPTIPLSITPFGCWPQVCNQSGRFGFCVASDIDEGVPEMLVIFKQLRSPTVPWNFINFSPCWSSRSYKLKNYLCYPDIYLGSQFPVPFFCFHNKCNEIRKINLYIDTGYLI